MSDCVWSSFRLPATTDKSNEEEQTPEVTGSAAGSGSPELATTKNASKDVLQVVDENRSLEDEHDKAFSIASEIPYQGQGNSAFMDAVSPKPPKRSGQSNFQK